MKTWRTIKNRNLKRNLLYDSYPTGAYCPWCSPLKVSKEAIESYLQYYLNVGELTEKDFEQVRHPFKQQY